MKIIKNYKGIEILGKKSKSVTETKLDKVQTVLMMLPSIIFLLVFSIYPIIWVLRYMFFAYDDVSMPVFIGLDNFVRVFTRDPYYWKSVLNTFIYAGGKILVTIPVSFLLALFLNEKLMGKNWIKATVFMPTIISTSIASMMFYYILNPYNGILNNILMSTGLVNEPINWLGNKHAMLAVIIVAIWGAIGNYMIYFLAGLQSIPKELYESAALDGANKFQITRFVTIPMLGPVLQVIIMLLITASLKGYESIMVLTAGGPAGKTEVMFLYVYKLFFPMSDGSDFRVDYGYGSAVSFVSALIVGIITCIYLWSSKKLSENE